METTKNIDEDVNTLHRELARHDGKFQFHCTKRCKYLLAVVGLLLLMFLFGMLTRPMPDTIVVQETNAVLDTQIPRVIQPDLNTRLSILFAESTLQGALAPTLLSTATAPAILTWTPKSVGRVHQDGAPVPLSGRYVIPAGWFGIIRVTADGEEIGSVDVDGRSLASPAGIGRFSLTPAAITGEHLIHVSFDAVKACRIACDPEDQVCMLTNPNYCVAQSDNQSFLTYSPVLAEALPPAGSCIEKTFVAGPKYAPQIPEDYTMCEKGMWNEEILPRVSRYLEENTRLSQPEVDLVVDSISQTLLTPSTGPGKTLTDTGTLKDVTWKVKYDFGDATNTSVCMGMVEMKISCAQK